MSNALTYLDPLFFAILPYAAMATFFIVTIYRYQEQSFSYSSLSSQFLENSKHFWATVPFHYGLLTILVGHFIGLCIPKAVLAWNGVPWRLYVLEIFGLIGGLFALVGLIFVIERRITNSKIKICTNVSDWIIYGLLVVQIFTGIYTAIFHPWGSSWYATSATPYLWSLAKLNPELGYISAMPFMVKLHIVNAFLLIGFFPFSRLVHILVMPNQYLWRRTQVVRWYGDWRKLRLRH